MPSRVQSEIAHFDPKLPPPDTAVATLRFASGALGTWTSCFSARYAGPMLRVYGSLGNAELRYGDVTFENAKGKRTTYQAERDSFEAEYLHFADVVQRGAPPRVSPADAFDDLSLIDAILHSRKAPATAWRASKRR
jgi:predicted dehydrogenase